MPTAVERMLTGKRVTADQIADSLNWPAKNRLRPVRFPDCMFLTLGEEPALVIADKGKHDPLAFAYHSGYEWVLDARPSANRISNTRWRLNDRIYEVPFGHEAFDLVKSLTPEGFETDQPTSIATKRQPFDVQVSSIESALIRKLGDLRRMAFRYTPGDPIKLDQDLHLLITQFFVLRAIEDLNLGANKGLLPLRRALKNGQLDCAVLTNIYEAACENIQSHLFDQHPFQFLAAPAVATTIEALYEQPEIPNNPKLNFGWIDPDVFGRVYERYLSTILTEAAPAAQPSLFENPIREVEEISQRRQGGVYYTPQPLVRILVQKAIDLCCPDGISLSNLPRVADFACGSGAFLAATLDKVLRSLPVQHRREATQRIISERRLIGVDVDKRAVSLARLNVYLRLAQEKEPLPLPDVDNCVYEGDSLAKKLPQDLSDLVYDSVVGNPPFLALAAIQDRETLPTRFKTAVGRYDFSSLFVELGINMVKPGGSVALVVPNRMFSNASAQATRDVISGACTLDTLVDFGSASVFEGVTAYIGLLICSKRTNSINSDSFRYVKVRSMPPSFSLEPLIRAIFGTTDDSTSVIDVSRERQPTLGSTWTAIPLRTRQLLVKLGTQGSQLSEWADVRQGIKTGANYIYVLRLAGDIDGPVVTVEDKSQRRFSIERSILRPAGLGPDVNRYRCYKLGNAGDQVILYPYEFGAPIPEGRLADEFPLAYSYLQSFQNELATRMSVTKSGQPWYGLIWPRDEDWLSGPKILSRDLIAGPSFAVDVDAGVYLIGGSAIIPQNPDHLFTLLGIMNSSVFGEFLRGNSSEYRGQYIKAEPGKLLDVFIPTSALEDATLADLVQERLSLSIEEFSSIEGDINDRVREHVEGHLH